MFFTTGERNYGPAVDLWGTGCIMAEMWTRSPIMQGNTEQHQLTLIAQVKKESKVLIIFIFLST